MIAVVQRVKEASVSVNGNVVGQIAKGALILLGVSRDDAELDRDYVLRKISRLRMFEDGKGKMNLDAQDVSAEFLVVSQFTLLGDLRKGCRPSFDRAAWPEQAKEHYDLFIAQLGAQGFKVATGRFAAMMDVALINDGPVTFVLDSKHKSAP